MPDLPLRLLAAGMLLLLSACSAEPDTGPAQVRWDRDACERCRMVLSDRGYAAQVRYFPQGGRSRVFKFDDIGCAVLWLEQSPWGEDPSTLIWVADHRTGDWINARTATYVKDRITPMEYGLGAQLEPVPGGMDFAQASRHIHEVEERFSVHGVQLLERLKAQAAKRASARPRTSPQSPVPSNQ